MINQKQLFIPRVNTIPVTLLDASDSFTTDFIEFPNSNKDWSVDISFGGMEVITDATMSILVCNTQDGVYKAYNIDCTDVDLMVYANQIIFDSIMPFKFMKLQYAAGTTTGTISIKISK